MAARGAAHGRRAGALVCRDRARVCGRRPMRRGVVSARVSTRRGPRWLRPLRLRRRHVAAPWRVRPARRWRCVLRARGGAGSRRLRVSSVRRGSAARCRHRSLPARSGGATVGLRCLRRCRTARRGGRPREVRDAGRHVPARIASRPRCLRVRALDALPTWLSARRPRLPCGRDGRRASRRAPSRRGDVGGPGPWVRRWTRFARAMPAAPAARRGARPARRRRRGDRGVAHRAGSGRFARPRRSTGHLA